jgi:hypothetical protein
MSSAFLQAYSPRVWGHLVTAHVDYYWLSAGLQLFAAPENLAPVYLIKLGRNPSRIVSPQQHEGSFFAIFPKDQRGEYDGEVVDAKPAAALLCRLLSRLPLPPPIQLR